jgi:hypothetical protein
LLASKTIAICTFIYKYILSTDQKVNEQKILMEANGATFLRLFKKIIIRET